MNTPHLWLAACMLCIATTANTLQGQSVESSSAPVLVQLDFPLSHNTLAQLGATGIDLLYHYGNGAYLLSRLPNGAQPLDENHLPQVEASVLRQFENDNRPLGDTRIDVDLIFAFDGAPAFLTHVLAEAEFHAAPQQIENGRSISGSVPIDALTKLLAHPYLLDVTPRLTEIVPYNFEARIVQSVTSLNSGIAGSPNLNGRGIVIGVGDGGALAGHPDMGDRVLHSTENYNAGWGSHPDMVSGIIAGAGNVFSANRGVASEAELIIESNSAITYFAPSYLQDYGMTITNNSYGPSFHCNTANQYFGNSASTDQQLYDNPALLHVYALGNSGSNNCPDMPDGYSTIPGGPQNAKNTLSVANVDYNRLRYQTSSAGPTKDGRLKPEISAVGTAITTTVRNGGYGTGTGTSFAAPNVASTLALLSEAFQRKNPGTPPEGALLKAIACNTADDTGRTGPDFEYGFGILNAYNALQVVESGQFEVSSIQQAQEHRKTITLANDATALKVMLYWNDVAGSTTNQQPVLVNDLDLVVISAEGETVFPLTLDPSNPLAEATQAEDHLNNIEQVVIPNPSQGEYEIVVRGTSIIYDKSDFILTWYAPQPEVVLTFPYGGESIIPGQTTYLAWTATTGDSGQWRLEYSSNGSDWTLIEENIPGGQRSIDWSAPMGISHAEFRVTNSELQLSDITNAPVSIVAPPQSLSTIEICESTLQFNWRPHPEAARYSVFRFDGERMQLAGSTTDTFWRFTALQTGEKLLLSVASVTESNHSSKRAFALEVTHSGQEPDCDLPSQVVWGKFLTEELGSAVQVLWEVDHEQRIQRFELERGMMQAHGLVWTYVDSVKAKGTSNTTLSYQLDDLGAAPHGFTYYRIRMVDKDGLDSYSEEFMHERTSPISSSSSLPTESKLVSFTVLQNPVGETIRIRSHKAKPQTLHLYDAIGRRLTSFSLRSGVNQFPWPSSLGGGLYILRVADKTSTKAVRIIRS